MTTPNLSPVTRYVPAGSSTGPFATVFTYEQGAEVRAERQAVDGTITPLTYGADYSVAATGGDSVTNGGVVTLGASGLPDAGWAGEVLVLYRATVLSQSTEFSDTGSFFPSSVEGCADKLTRVAQEQRSDLGRAILNPRGQPGFSLPPGPGRGGKLAMFAAVSPYAIIASDQTLGDFEAEIAAGALALLQASLPGASAFYTTYALANAAVGGLAANTIVEVYADETARGQPTRYRVVGGVLAYRIILAKASNEIDPYDYGWVDGGALLSAQDIANNPQWIGKPVIVAGTPTTRTVQWTTADFKNHAAYQEAVHAALHSTSIAATASVQGTVIPNNIAGLTKRDRPIRIPSGDTYLGDTLLAVGDAVLWRGDGRLVCRLCVVTPVDKPGILMDSATFSRFSDFGVVGMNPNHAALIDFDHTGVWGAALATQQNIFDGLAISANNSSVYRGIRYNRIATGYGQGSECTYLGCYIAGFDIAAVEDSGFNALNHSFFGGDLLLNNKDGVAVYGGWAKLHSMSCESQGRQYNNTPIYTPHTTDGADLHVYSQAGLAALSAMLDTRTEGDIALKSPYVTTAGRVIAVSAGHYPDSRSFARVAGMVFSGLGTRGRSYQTISDGADDTIHTPEYLPMPGGAIGQALLVIPGFVGLKTSGGGLAGCTFINRFSSSFTYLDTVVSNTATTITIAAPASGPIHVLGTKYKIAGKSAVMAPGVDSSTEAHKVNGGTAEGFTGLAGSYDVTIGNDLAYVDVGGYVAINGAYTLTEGDYSFTTALYARVDAIAGHTLTLNRKLVNDVTEATGWCCTASQVIVDGGTAMWDYPFGAFETRGSVVDCAANSGVVRNASHIWNYTSNPDSRVGGTRTDWNRNPSSNSGGSWIGGALSLGQPLMQIGANAASNAFDLAATFVDARPAMQKLAITGNATLNCTVVPAAGVTLDLVVSCTGGTYTVAGAGNVKMLGTDTVATGKTRIWSFLSDGASLLQRCLPGPPL